MEGDSEVWLQLVSQLGQKLPTHDVAIRALSMITTDLGLMLLKGIKIGRREFLTNSENPSPFTVPSVI